MVRRSIALVAAGLLGAGCGSSSMSSSDTLAYVQASLKDAGIPARRVAIDTAASNSYRAVAIVGSHRLTFTVDRSTGTFRRIEVPDHALTDAQVQRLAQQRRSETSARTRQFLAVLGATLAVALVGLGLARRGRLREEAKVASRQADETEPSRPSVA